MGLNVHWTVILAIVLGAVSLVGVLAIAIAFGVSPGASHSRLFTNVRGVHAPVRAATTSPIDRGLVQPRFHVDDVLMQDGDRVLLKNQNNPRENGIYIVGQPLRRAGDLSRSAQIIHGNRVYVVEGTENGSTAFRLAVDEVVPTLGKAVMQFEPEIHNLFHEPQAEDFVLTSSDHTRHGIRWKHIAGLLNVYEGNTDRIGVADASEPGGMRFENDFRVHTTGVELPGSMQVAPVGNPDVFNGSIPIMIDNGGTPVQAYLWTHTNPNP